MSTSTAPPLGDVSTDPNHEQAKADTIPITVTVQTGKLTHNPGGVKCVHCHQLSTELKRIKVTRCTPIIFQFKGWVWNSVFWPFLQNYLKSLS
jgi:CRISPR/Cas system endoribonuclease Cas6 (RAMP superfamily)